MSSTVLTLFLLLFSSYRPVFFYQEVGTCVLSTVDLLLSLMKNQIFYVNCKELKGVLLSAILTYGHTGQ